MLDFTSALYLGIEHRGGELAPWRALTTGRPAALEASTDEHRLGAALASLVGCPAALLGASTLHLFWDLFGVLAERQIAVFVDDGTYPIAGWGAERAAGLGVPVRRFARHDPEALRRELGRAEAGRRPIVVTDGFGPVRGGAAPLGDYLAATREREGWLVIDDTQALGILGERADTGTPYGRGGGGSLRYHGLGGEDIVVVSSLAKAFGAPLAMIAGAARFVDRFERRSETRVHTSPPSASAFTAAHRALAANAAEGDARRSRLARTVCRFRERLAAPRLHAAGGTFPVQELRAREVNGRSLYEGLLRRGVRAVLARSPRGAPAVRLLFTTQHSDDDVDAAVGAIARLAA